jgi:N-acetylglucosamine repressor
MTHPGKTRAYRITGANSRTVRSINRAVVFNIIRERQPISRALIARLTRLNKSTVSSIVSTLVSENLILEEPIEQRTPGRSTFGRIPINLGLRKGKSLVGAISFDPVTTLLAVIDIDGSIVCSDEIKTDVSPKGAFVARCAAHLLTLRRQSRLPPLKGIGVSIAGIVDPMQARVVLASNLGWEDLDVGGIIRKKCPEAGVIAVENDAKAAALAELWFGKHDVNLVNFVFLSVGRGIGTGIVIDRRVLTGESNLAGEFGHMVLIEGGEPCGCGNAGCWEAYASDRATVARYAAARGDGAGAAASATIGDVIEAAKAGDAAALGALKTTGRYLGMGIANILKAIDPGTIIVGGRLCAAWDLFAPELHETVRTQTFAGTPGMATILPTSLAARPSLLGAAATVQRRIFSDVRVTL